MFGSLRLPSIDDSGGLYFGGGAPAGWAWGITNYSPPDFYIGSSNPEFFEIAQTPVQAQPDSGGGWLSPAQQVPYPGVYTPAAEAATQPAQSVPYSQALQLPLTSQAANALQSASAKLGISSTYLLIGGGILLLILLKKK